MKKRLLSVILAVCMVLGLLPGTVWASEITSGVCGKEGGNLSWTFDKTAHTLTVSGTGEMMDYHDIVDGTNAPWFSVQKLIKTIIIEEGVTSIGNSAFSGGVGGYYYNEFLTVILPSSLISIGEYAFSGCDTLKEIEIPSNVTQIGREAFKSCFALESIVIPEGITRIESETFIYCNKLANVTLSSNLEEIGSGAFFDCAITNILIPQSVTSIDMSAFSGASKLERIDVEANNSVYASIDGVLFSKDYISLLRYPCAKSGDYTIPNNVTTIVDRAFSNCSKLSGITIPSNVTRINTGAFFRCFALKNIVIPASITSIEKETFKDCNNISSITIPQSVVKIDAYAFDPLFPESSLYIADFYYEGSEDKWANMSIGERAISPGATIHYNSSGPDDPGDTGTQKANGVLRSGDGWQLLWECSWKDVAGGPTNGRVDITMTGAANRTDEIYIYNESSNQGFPWELAPHSIPKSAIKTLSISGESVGKRLRIAANSFQNYSNLETVLLDDVTGIDSYAFEGCSALESVEFLYAAELTTIGKGAFKNCTGLSTIELPNNLEHIGDEAFQNTALGTITLGRSITEIGVDAFSGCRNVKIRCYENSVAHRYAQDNSIPFELINENLGNVNIYCGNGRIEPFDNMLEYYVSQTSSTVYNPKLSHMLIALSNAAYDVNNIKDSMKELGFSDSNIYCHYIPGDFSDVIAYAIAKKTLPSGKNLVLVTVRGSSSSLDWLSNFAIGNSVAGCFWHAGFESAVNEVYSDLSRIVANDFTNTTFVVTGHSRGAAVANLLEVKLFDAKVPTQNVYGYNFACPDVAAGLPTGWNWLGEHNNIFNIGNAPDPVSVVPGVFGSAFLSAIPGTTWGKFGQSRWFSKNWNNLSETTLDMSFSAHDQKAYLDYLSKEPAFNTFKTWAERNASILASQAQTLGKLFTACCPVDITITDDNGKQIASVIGGEENYYDSAFGEVVIFRDGDKKAIFVQGSQPLNVRFTATDSGTMDYTVQTINIDSSDILSQKTFTNVSLEQGKQMLSMADVEAVTGVGVDVSKVPLYVLDSAGNPEKNVLPDGKGTEVPIDTPLECEHSYTANVTAPTCTERGYTTYTCTKCDNSYVDTYTATLGHSYGEWTVVTPATNTTNGLRERICTRCSDRQTNVIPATGGGSSHDNPGSSSSDPTYRIDAPSKITGGTIKITPTSARENQRVTITVKPNTSYILEQLIVTDNKGDVLALADKGDGKYTFTMPKGKVTVNAVFQPIEKPWSTPFQDVTADMWYYNAVRFVSENDLMNGISSNLFAPNTNLSRAQLAQILYNKEGRPEVEKATFTDVPDGEWYSNAVAWAAEKGIVSGYGNGLFGPGDNITREQLAVMLWRYAGSPAATNKELHFADMNEISSYALDALCWATENGIINGYGEGELAPKGEATRAQVAQMLMNYLNNSF